MSKKFVPLDSEVGPSETPYDIITFVGAVQEERPVSVDPCYGYRPKPCKPEKNTTPINTEEAICRLLEIPHNPRFQKTCEQKCKNLDSYRKCVMDQRAPSTLKHHAVVREKYLKVTAETMQKVHDAQSMSSEAESLIQMESPIVTQGKVLPKPASPSCSLETFYVPSRKLLDLKRPKSGIFINETPRPEDSRIPYETYDPRILQERLESQSRTKYTLYSDGDKYYYPWMQNGDSIPEPKFNETDGLREDCIKFMPVIFPIPNDLDKTFRAVIVFSNIAVSPHEESNGPVRPMEVACMYAAYVESFIKNLDYWTDKTMDSIIQSGAELHEKSIERMYEDPQSDFDIIPELKDRNSTVELKLHLTSTLIDEPNILKALTLFFYKYPACVLCSENLYLLVWKRAGNSFYIFDPNGRDMRCKRDFEKGKASLIVIQTVEHIVHLVLNYSDVGAKSEFNLYEIRFKDFGKLSNPIRFEEVKPAKKLYAGVNRFYAIVPGLTGLPHVAHHIKPGEDNPSLMISYLALLYSQMNSAREWTMQVVEDLIQFGKKYHLDYTSDNRLGKLNIVDIPDVVFLGNYRILVEKSAFYTSGHIVDCWSYRVSLLTLAIVDFFSAFSTGILQVDASTFGIWKEKDMYYVFDPFKRGPAGQFTTSSKTGAGCLQMHLNLDSLCRIIFMNTNAIKTEGNYFLHGIRVKSVGTFNLNRAMADTASFGTLHIKFPFDCESVPQERGILFGDCAQKQTASNLNYTLVQCLSELSVRPCERAVSEREFIQEQKKKELRKKLNRTPSIHSIPEQLRIPEFDDTDVIDSVVGEYICDLMTHIQRKTEKQHKACINASKILLQSDKGYLEDLKLRLKRGEDYDNIYAAFKTKPPTYSQLTLEEELAVVSNFTEILDGAWAIFGTTSIDDEPIKGILATITAAALSSKYNVSTWSSDVIEYALEASSELEERFWSYNHTLELIFRKQIPKIQLGSSTHYIKVLNTETVMPDELKESLANVLQHVSRLFLICKGLTCLILKRYNFIYMFMGCPCDVVGFRSNTSGPMCLMRFIELTTLVQRIANACGRCGKYVIVQLDVKDITEPRRDQFTHRTESQEELQYVREVSDKKHQKQRHRDKVLFIEDELRREELRVKAFRKQKRRPNLVRSGGDASFTVSSASGTEVPEGLNEAEEYEQSEDSVEYKHKAGKSLENAEDEGVAEKTIARTQFGYQLRDQDCLFKIQGTTALDDRLESFADQIKTCYFASVIAVLYAILRPLNHWDPRRIDKVIHVAKNVAQNVTNRDTASERVIKNIDVDEFTFRVKVQTFTPPGTFGGNLEYNIIKTIQTHRHFLIQISNETFAVYYDGYFHLFDAYPSMDLGPDNGEPAEKPPECPETIPVEPEQNTASWVLFRDNSAMLKYIEKRASSENWKDEYVLHIVSIISYKTAPKRMQLLNLLTDEFNTCERTPESANICTHAEQIEWLDVYPNVVMWSRLNRSNANHRVRGSPITKEGNFDIELHDELYSLWGSIHPMSAVFGESRGKQHLAICVVACCVAYVYQVSEWNQQILDSIVITGNFYYQESIATINRTDYEISLEHLNTMIKMGHLEFEVHLESATFGYLYAKKKNELNLAAALTYFFRNHRYGIIQCMKRSLAIGKSNGGFFMFDCQSYGLPLFHSGQGAAYIMRAKKLEMLLYCIIMTLNLPYYNAQFTIHKVEMIYEKVEQNDEEAENA